MLLDITQEESATDDAGVKALITIVAFTTYQVWAKAAMQEGVVDKPERKGVRRKTPDEIKELVLRLSRENRSVYSRILGESKKPGIKTSRSNVVNILKANGFDPHSKRGEGSWKEFIAVLRESLWQCDFFSKILIRAEGFRPFLSLVFLNVASREAFVSPCTTHRHSAWMEGQSAAFLTHAKAIGKPEGLVFRNRDDKYVLFVETLAKHGCQVNKLPVRSPNMNAFVERFIQCLEVELFGHVLVFGPEHFDYFAASYLDYYQTVRPNQSLGYKPIRPTGGAPTTGEVCCADRRLAEILLPRSGVGWFGSANAVVTSVAAALMCRSSSRPPAGAALRAVAVGGFSQQMAICRRFPAGCGNQTVTFSW